MSAAVSDYINMFTGLYAAPTERSGRSVPRVVEELTSFHGALPAPWPDAAALIALVPLPSSLSTLLASRAAAVDLADCGSFYPA